MEEEKKTSPIYGGRVMVASLIALPLLIILGVGGFYYGVQTTYANKVMPGVQVLGVNVGGESLSEARYLIKKQLATTRTEELEIYFDKDNWKIKPGDYDFSVDVDQLADDVMAIGRRGSLSQRFNERYSSVIGKKSVEVNSGTAVEIDEPKLQEFLTNEVEPQINQEMKEATLTIKGMRATEFKPSQAGRVLNVAGSVDAIKKQLIQTEHKVKLAVELDEPESSLASTNDLGINTLIARGVSDFTGSPTNRRHNIKTGAAKFDGVIFKPGETISFMKTLGPVDGKAGFLPELVIKKDKTTPEYGGGLCQVSTTAFRAALNGGRKIDARVNHSYRVAYYEPAGTDATVYDPYPDFKFTNDTSGHMLIDTYIEGNKLYFDYYGTDPEREVKIDGPYISNVTGYPEPIYIDTSTIPEGTTKQIEVAHKGADAVLYRKVMHDGKTVHNDTFKSHYIPWPAKFLKGVVEAAPVETNLNNVAPPSSGTENPQAPITEQPETGEQQP